MLDWLVVLTTPDFGAEITPANCQQQYSSGYQEVLFAKASR